MKDIINLVTTSKRVHALVVRTSIMYGDLADMWHVSESLTTVG